MTPETRAALLEHIDSWRKRAEAHEELAVSPPISHQNHYNNGYAFGLRTAARELERSIPTTRSPTPIWNVCGLCGQPLPSDPPAEKERTK